MPLPPPPPSPLLLPLPLLQHPHMERIMLRKRKGFVRVAVEVGVDGIVPVYHFGNTQVCAYVYTYFHKCGCVGGGTYLSPHDTFYTNWLGFGVGSA